jgi:hypothetical protein
MATNVFNTPRAITISVYVVRAFVRLQGLANTQKDFTRKLEDLGKRLGEQTKSLRLCLRRSGN